MFKWARSKPVQTRSNFGREEWGKRERDLDYLLDKAERPIARAGSDRMMASAGEQARQTQSDRNLHR
jgi:hypothetical protein